MSGSRGSDAGVIDFAGAALARARRAGTSASPTTLVVRVSTLKADEDIYRYLGLNSDLPLTEVQRVIAAAFSLPDDTPTPAQFSTDAATLGEALSGANPPLSFTWGLWRFDLFRAGAYPRDAATPNAVCIAGAGDFTDAPFDITEVNRRLVGDDTANGVLATIHPEARDVITRSRMFDFVLLLQALDVGKEGVDKRARDVARTLPRERSPEARDAYWCVVLGLACLADAPTTNSVIESTFRALGWPAHTADEIRALCAGSLVRLAAIGAYGPGQAAPVERVDVFRELLRR
ncbi:hypothetical protein [Corynebacterium sp.]|uniref:hypothetical protein n=1 Tax=Corynebacterium sp. TaxID=1720 RepID=UPI002A9203BB|nr:hypothetical protein [Corynebacterium sp.]MDY5784834.1 hypothetical protein [Corynebacterium sp.]